MTIPALLESRVGLTPEAVAHWSRDNDGQWKPTSWKEYWEAANRLASGLRELGVKEHHTVGLMASTSQKWEYLHTAILISGAVVVGIDPHDSAGNINEIAARSNLSGLIVQDPSLLEKISDSVGKDLIFVVTITGTVTEGTTSTYATFDELQRKATKSLNGPGIRVQSDDPATIVFTSGTTGAPKGVLYTHEQVVSACASILSTIDDITTESNLVCWLPLSNLFQRIVNFCAVSSGASTYFIENPRDLIRQLPVVNPHILIGVPRFFEKVHDGIMAGIQQKPFLVRRAVEWAISAGDEYACALRMKNEPGFSKRIRHRVADALILNRMRSILGKNLKFIVSGSAPMPVWLLEWFHAIGIVVLEAYGITENIIPVAMNTPHSFKFGTVGTALPGNDVVIADDGELLVKGKGVFHGYHRDETHSAPLSANGYLATGDYAEIDTDGFITLKGRKSEVFKTSTGHRIAPSGIESCIRRIPYVEHAVVFGAGRKCPLALLSVSIDSLRIHILGGERNSIKNGTRLQPDVLDSIRKDVQREVSSLPPHQRPAGILITTDPFTVDGGDLTANLKIRRKNAEYKYREHIERVYGEMEKFKDTSELFVDCL